MITCADPFDYGLRIADDLAVAVQMAAQPHVSQRLRRKIRLEQLAVGEHRETALIRADLDARAIDQLGVVMMSSRMPKTRAALMARRFPPPWTVEEQDAYFVVRDHNGQQLVFQG